MERIIFFKTAQGCCHASLRFLGTTHNEGRCNMKRIAILILLIFVFFAGVVEAKYLGKYSQNKYDSDSTSNPYGQYGSEYSADSINNPYGTYGSAYSSQGARNPYTNEGAKLYSSDGQFLGNVNSNPYDPDSISNPYGAYGSEYSSTSVNNEFSQYGSPFSDESANNPFATDAPIIVSDD